MAPWIKLLGNYSKLAGGFLVNNWKLSVPLALGLYIYIQNERLENCKENLSELKQDLVALQVEQTFRDARAEVAAERAEEAEQSLQDTRGSLADYAEEIDECAGESMHPELFGRVRNGPGNGR